MANGFDLQQFATALQGAGAGLTGQLTPFLAQQERQRRTQVEESKLANQKAKDSERERMITLFQDSQRGLELAKAGQWDRLANLASRREQLLATDFPETNATDTQQFALVARAAAAGDPQAQQAALFKLQENTNIGLDTGILDPPKAPKQQIVDGQVVTLGDRPTAVPIEGFTPTQRGRDTLSQVQSSQILPNGSTVQVFRDGSTRVTGPQGKVLTGQERATAVEDAQEFGIDIQSRRAGGRAGATGIEQRASALITRGIAAAESTATVRRALDLLDRVKTGGIAAISLAVRQRLGIEGADEGELSNSLGKAVLSQLRETFGSAFTESEGERLIRLEAAIGKSPESNRRILGQALRIAERTANRAIKAAEKRGNQAEAADIRDLLTFSLDIEPLQQAPPAGQQQTGQQRNVVVDF